MTNPTSAPMRTRARVDAVPRTRIRRDVGVRPLPAWPVVAAFVGTPVWWLLGLGDMVWFPLIPVLGWFLIRHGDVRVPRGFGVWALFFAWMCASVIGIDTSGRLIGFVYRALLFLAFTLLFVYVYNARERLGVKTVLDVLTGYWLVVVLGGWIGVLLPLLQFTTPLAYVLPESLTSNEVISEMVFRRVTQFNPDSPISTDPRPSAPFLYTNSWGNAYSLLTPAVLASLVMLRGSKRLPWLLAALVLSLVPAFLTLNRGMFLGLGVAAVYIAIRLALRRNFRAIIGLVALGAVVGTVFLALPVEERLADRVETSSTTEDRLNLYDETWQRTLESPLFGYGAPRPSEIEGAPSAGTQGQVWTLMFSHGIPAVLLFMGFLGVLWWRTRRLGDPFGLAANTGVVVLFVECFYYGVQTSGLHIVFVLTAVALRDEDARIAPPPSARRHRVRSDARRARRAPAPRERREVVDVR